MLEQRRKKSSPSPSPSHSAFGAACIFIFLLHHYQHVVLVGAARRRGVVDSAAAQLPNDDFVTTNGIRFLKDGQPFYFNGFNAYWMMLVGSNPGQRGYVTSVFQQANKYGMTVVRTWAFSDGGNTSTPLQSAPGVYNEEMFKGLDFVLSEASKYKIKVILSLVNNYPDFGGRKQYVQWGKDLGAQKLTSDDDFYINPVVKAYYKNHVKAVLGRQNTISMVTYKDDPTIFAWELINEPRCESDYSGATLQAWIQEMAGYVKSIDSKHLLEVGTEGFYGESKKQYNPNSYIFGTDFISNHQIPEIDFATIHAYPDAWLPGSGEQAQVDFVRGWLQVHINDSSEVLKKPLVFAEFGKSSKDSGFNSSQRDSYFSTLYGDIYASARSGGSCNGGIFWQVLDQGMDNFRDGYEVILAENPSTANIIAQQSKKLSHIR